MHRVLYDCHTHTYLSRHASGTPDDYAREAVEAGLRGIIFTCHGPVPEWGTTLRMSIEELAEYLDLVEKTRSDWAGTLDVLLGLESDFFPGLEGWTEKLHSMAPFDFVLGSVHPFTPQYEAKYSRGPVRAKLKSYFSLIADAAESRLFDSIAHPDLIKCIYPDIWKQEDMQEVICNCLERLAPSGAALEVNTSGLYKPYPELQPGRFMLEEARKHGIRVTLGSDAHDAERVADGFPGALDALLSAGYKEVTYFRSRRPYGVDILEALESLKK